MTSTPKKPPPKAPEPYTDKLGQPIPLEHFGNEIPITDITGPTVDHARKLIKDAKIANAAKAKK